VTVSAIRHEDTEAVGATGGSCKSVVTTTRVTGGIAQMSERQDSEYDVIVLGAGPVGQSVAAAHAQAAFGRGGRTELVGGECSYWGCIPARRCCAPSSPWPMLATWTAPRGGHRILDTAKVFGRRDRYVSNWTTAARPPGSEHWRRTLPCHARLVGPRRVAIETPASVSFSTVACGGHLHRSTAALPDILAREGGSLDQPQSD